MKRNKLRLVTKILAIIIICLVSFVGIYVQKANKMENKVKGYEFSKDLEGYRQVIFKLSDANKVLDSDGKEIGDTDTYDDSEIESNKYQKSEEKVNSEESRNVENYEIAKNIIEKRIKGMGVKDYNLSLDKQNGSLYLQIPEDDNTDKVVSNVAESGKIELKDSEDGTVFLTNDNLKKARTMYNTTETGTTVYLDLQFNKEGKEILKDLSSNEYATVKEEADNQTEEENNETNTSNENDNSTEKNESDDKTTENKEESKEEDKKEDKDKNDEETKEEEKTEEESTETKQKKVVLSLSGSDVVSTSFDEVVNDGKIDLSMDKESKDNKEITETLQTASRMAILLNEGPLPLVYTVDENEYVGTDISAELVRNVLIVVSVVIAILLVYMIIKNKIRGLLAAISYIGFVALYLLIIRYTNVVISLEGIIATIIMLGINYLFNMKLLKIKEDDKKKYYREYLSLTVKLIPILAISIVFTFAKLTVLNSFGMIMFWGIVLISIYNILVTKHIID